MERNIKEFIDEHVIGAELVGWDSETPYWVIRMAEMGDVWFLRTRTHNFEEAFKQAYAIYQEGYEAMADAHNAATNPNPENVCHYCGESSGEVTLMATAPPVDGFEASEEPLHQECADQIARNLVR